MTVNKMMYILLLVLISTFCAVVIFGCIGVAYGKVDAQYVEGIVSGALLTLICTVLKDLINKGDDPAAPASTQTTTQTPPKVS